MYQQLWGYKVEEKLYLGVREQKRLNTTELKYDRPNIRTATITSTSESVIAHRYKISPVPFPCYCVSYLTFSHLLEFISFHYYAYS
jgi:hypothetical protein